MSDEFEVKRIDAWLTVRPGSLEDWWLIEREKHDGRSWIQPDKYGSAFMTSARITNADIEGAGVEMLGIAKAIRDRGEYRAKRCAVAVGDERVELWSPRNSTYAASVPLPVADELATRIESEVKAQ